MRKNRHVLLLVSSILIAGSCLSHGARQAATEPRDAVKILTIGNSFTVNANQFLPLFVEAAEKELLLFPANLGGASFERHVRFLKAHEEDPASEAGRPYKGLPHPETGAVKDFSLREALEATDWDYVTIQQVSSQSFKPETFEPAHTLIAHIQTHDPEAEILIHQTWAYRRDFEGYSENGFTLEKMHDGLTTAYRQLADEYGLRIIPVGDAFHAARQTPIGNYTRDPNFDFNHPPDGELPDQAGSLIVGYRWRGSGENRRLHLDFKHANDAGKYLGAAVWYEILFGEPAPDHAPVPPKLSPENAASLRRIARETVQAQIKS